MRETETSLVTWEPESLDRVPDSEWTCPVDGVDRLALFEISGGIITDEVICRIAGGRPQHLEKVRYPEGYQAIQIVDSETGEIQEAPARQYRYEGCKCFDCDCGMQHPRPRLVPPISAEKPLDIGEGRYVISVANHGYGVQTLTQASPLIEGSLEEYYNRKYTSALLLPKTKSFGLYVQCQAGDFPGHISVNITDRVGQTEAHFTVYAEDHGIVGGDLQVRLNAVGEPTEITSHNPGALFAVLGLNSIGLGATKSQKRWEVIGSDQKNIALQGIAEIVGMGRWRNVDLRMTAAGLFAAMGQQKPDLKNMLITRS